ncbi:MAG: arylsulfatase [Cyclobacteriaceae bacterium]|nr:arylsulfatase [Cyclobacteriaceae bacterium]
MRNLPFSLLMLLPFTTTFFQSCTSPEPDRPNVILIITDDQGYGDLGFTGNPHVKTPVLDEMAQRSIRLNRFYVSPVCAPTRSSLMTGRYSLRTGVRDTYNGGATMATEEITIAEMLKGAGYTTGMFGKWHLGDNYPFRPGDQGFDESLIHLAGGMGQPGDFTTFFRNDSSYFDPILWYNGDQKEYTGYCSDIFTDEAIRFIGENHKQPFFCYLSFNAPHTPLQLPQQYYDMYRDIDPSAGFNADGRPFPEMNENDKEDARKVYGMVSNIDDNVGRIYQKLDELGIRDNTILIFMTDNGPQQRRYNGGMRGLKGTVFKGGIRVPFFLHYPNMQLENKDIDVPAAHIDILPTLADICNATLPADRKIDGKSLLPVFQGNESDDWNQRSLFFYWTRRFPELYNNIAVQKGSHKLVGQTHAGAMIENFQLYDIQEDPYEQINLVAQKQGLASDLKKEMDDIFYELIQSEHLLGSQHIIIGSEFENPVYLNRNDAGGDRGVWRQEEVYGKWDVEIREGRYDVQLKFINPLQTRGRIMLECNGLIQQVPNEITDTDLLEMKNMYFPDLQGPLVPFYETEGRRILPLWVGFRRL